MTAGAEETSPVVDEVEVLVVGSGPAGSSCAARLAEHGHDVLLVDQNAFPRDKACGDGITDASVRVLERLGLGNLLADSMEICGIRTFFGEGPKLRLLDRPARCVSRSRLDQGVLSVALERGARFAQLRVDGPLIERGTVVGVSSAAGGGRILARCVIAADGATSRLRRGCGFLPPPSHRRAYAVRQYVQTEKPLAPYFDLTPLVHHGVELLGYGWVFPMDERTANVGVGYYRSQTMVDPPSLNAVLDEFIDGLPREQGGLTERSCGLGGRSARPSRSTLRPDNASSRGSSSSATRRRRPNRSPARGSATRCTVGRLSPRRPMPLSRGPSGHSGTRASR
jgi:flavin-dependent dehydrogenase